MRIIDPTKLSGLIRSHAEAQMLENRIGGIEIIVRQNDAAVFHDVFGWDSADGRPLQKNMLYRIASMTKPITAVAVLQLADRGLIDLDAPAALFYPQLRHMQVAEVKDGKIAALKPANNLIRVADLLSHTSGIGCSPLLEIMGSFTAQLTFDAAVSEILRQPLSFEPRTNQAYSATAAFDVAAGIVELVSGMAFDDYLSRNIFEPLGMTDVTFAPSVSQWDRMVDMHDRTADGKSMFIKTKTGNVFEPYIPARMAAGAGLAATAEDYIRFAEMLRRGGVSEQGERILSEAMVRRMSSSNVPESIDMGCERWGLGVRVITSDAYPHGLCRGCFGWSGAYGSHFWVDRENEISVVMMKNSRFDGGAGNASACALERDVSASLI